jgi:hypothetical protein
MNRKRKQLLNGSAYTQRALIKSRVPLISQTKYKLFFFLLVYLRTLGIDSIQNIQGVNITTLLSTHHDECKARLQVACPNSPGFDDSIPASTLQRSGI